MALFELLHLIHFATTPQIEQLVFAGTETRRVSRRLRALFDSDYLARVPLRVGMNLEVVHTLGQRGAAQLARRDGIGATQFGFRESKATDHHDWPFLWHAVLISEVYTRLALALNEIGGDLDWWITERSLKADRLRADRPKRPPVIPDALFALSVAGRSAHFALELVRTTNDPAPFKQKVVRYSDYVSSGLYREQYARRSPTVLTVVAGEATTAAHQLDRLKVWTEQALMDRTTPGAMFYFSTLAELTPSSFLSESIWHVANGSAPLALLGGERPRAPGSWRAPVYKGRSEGR